MKFINVAGAIIFATVLMFAPLTQSAQAQCPADVNNDQQVDSTDLASVLSAWGTNGSKTGTDINGDGNVDAVDLGQVLAGWGPCSGPTWATVLEWAPDPLVVTDANLRAAIVASGFAWRIQDNATGIEMLLVPEGTFMMGCSPSAQYGCSSNEFPIHQVTLTNAFYMGRYEVTQAQWTAKMGSNPSHFGGQSNNPVEEVSWDMIASGSASFMSLTGLRLPTEAEWEYAYRAETTTAFHSYPSQPTGFNDALWLGNIAWYDSNSGNQTHAVGGKFANALGLHDMSGNVWEWCQDWFGPYSSGSVTNPTGPTTGDYRVLRGGAWAGNSDPCRASDRSGNWPDWIASGGGFRVVRTANPTTITSITPTSGSTAGGTAITITGTNFLTGATSVTVGGVAATSVVVVSSTSVTAVTPAGSAGAVSVAVTTPSGTITMSGAFTYIVVPTWATLLEAAPDPLVVTDANLRAAIVASGFAWRIQDNATGIEMLLVPEGTFMMGCSPSTQHACYSDEFPIHEVTLTDAFYMGRYEVTQAQWTAKMGSNPSYFVPANGYSSDTTKPVEQVSWNMIAGAGGFMSETGLRLPTEAEWEYAYRAETTTAFHSYPSQPTGFNDDTLLGNIAWYGSNAGNQTHPVGGKFANALGLHDMSGNVWEWCQDWYSSTYYASSPSTNPTGPTTGTDRVDRGGGWAFNSDPCRASDRIGNLPDWIAGGGGFRVVRTANPPTITSITPTSGSTLGGTAITITGTSLTGATSVTVGGVAATSVVVVSSTSVTAVTPAGSAGAVSVAVTTPNGTATASEAFRYFAIVVPAWATLLEATPDPAVVTDANLRAAIVASEFAWRIQDNATGIEMLLVPEGTFTMGCSPSDEYACNSNEFPIHQVTLTNAFYMGRYEVTQAQWTAKMGSNPSHFGGRPNNPVEEVSWDMIASGSNSFMSLTGLRLPTEAEWEYAYRAETTTAFHSYPSQPTGFNDDALVGNIAWYKKGVKGGTHPVGGKFANALGLHDMSGNVWESCQDWYSSTYYASSPSTNPTGPTTGTDRVLRGGGYYDYSGNCRASRRVALPPDLNGADVGFRVVRNP